MSEGAAVLVCLRDSDHEILRREASELAQDPAERVHVVERIAEL